MSFNTLKLKRLKKSVLFYTHSNFSGQKSITSYHLKGGKLTKWQFVKFGKMSKMIKFDKCHNIVWYMSNLTLSMSNLPNQVPTFKVGIWGFVRQVLSHRPRRICSVLPARPQKSLDFLRSVREASSFSYRKDSAPLEKFSEEFKSGTFCYLFVVTNVPQMTNPLFQSVWSDHTSKIFESL